MSARTENTDHLSPLARLQFELAHPPYHAFLRPQAVSVDAENGIVEIRLPFRPEFQRVLEIEDDLDPPLPRNLAGAGRQELGRRELAGHDGRGRRPRRESPEPVDGWAARV